MNTITSQTLDSIMERTDIADVIQQFIPLKRRGPRWLGLCPFHDDRHLGSFVVYPKGHCYKCFACGAKGDAVTFLREHAGMDFRTAVSWLGSRAGIPVGEVPAGWTPPPVREVPPLPVLYLPCEMMTAMQKAGLGDDPLAAWLRSGIHWNATQRARLEEVLQEYHVCHSGKTGMTIFWQLDHRRRLRTGKMMLYRPDGHRDRTARYGFDWIHSALTRRRDIHTGRMLAEPPWPHADIYDPDRQEVVPTLFGMHLLDRYPGAEVCIVESEKTALIMATAFGNDSRHLWMACGGLEMLNRERLEPLTSTRRRIMLYPDRDGIARWKAKSKRIGYEHMRVNTDYVTRLWNEADGPKADPGDVVVRILNGLAAGQHSRQTVEDVRRAVPQAAELIDRLGLQPI